MPPCRLFFLILTNMALLSVALPAGGKEPSDQILDLAEARADAMQHVDLRIAENGWGDASAKDVSAVLHSSVSELAVHFQTAQLNKLEPIRVSYDKSGPITLYQRNLRGEIAVMLDSKNRKWSQLAYQMAHEFGHIICRTKKADPSNLWFEESLCELASIFALRQMAKSWQSAPPYPNWKDYSSALDAYADDLIEKYDFPAGITLAAWYESHSEALRKDPTNRTLNGKVAIRMLDWFESDPENWQAIYYLNVGPAREVQTFTEYLDAWHRNTPGQHQPFVARLAKEFGVTLASKAKATSADPKGR
jgi:hypothetical protein